MAQQTYDAMVPVMGAYQEKNCCTVVALAAALDWSFGKAHRHMAKHGRKQGKGMYIKDWLPAIKDAARKEGKHFVGRSHIGVGMTLTRFAKTYPTGTYYVQVKRHAICIRDGQLIDWTASTAGRRKIISVFKLED